MSAIQGQQTAFSPLLTVANEVIKTTGVVEIIEQGINSFFDGMPVLMSALDKLGELHPFIGGQFFFWMIVSVFSSDIL